MHLSWYGCFLSESKSKQVACQHENVEYQRVGRQRVCGRDTTATPLTGSEGAGWGGRVPSPEGHRRTATGAPCAGREDVCKFGWLFLRWRWQTRVRETARVRELPKQAPPKAAPLGPRHSPVDGQLRSQADVRSGIPGCRCGFVVDVAYTLEAWILTARVTVSASVIPG
jgi:hypothetical protein